MRQLEDQIRARVVAILDQLKDADTCDFVTDIAAETSMGCAQMEGRIEISSENIKEALDLSMALQIAFRELGYRVLSKPAMEEFERTLNVAQVESN